MATTTELTAENVKLAQKIQQLVAENDRMAELAEAQREAIEKMREVIEQGDRIIQRVEGKRRKLESRVAELETALEPLANLYESETMDGAESDPYLDKARQALRRES